MTATGQVRKGARFDSVKLMGVRQAPAALPGVADAVDDAVGLRVRSVPVTAQKAAVELHGIRHDDVKGSCMVLCFAGQPESYGFRATGQ